MEKQIAHVYLAIGESAPEHADAPEWPLSSQSNAREYKKFYIITAKRSKNGPHVLTNRESLLEHVDTFAQVPLWSGCDDYITTEIGSPLVSEFDATGVLSGYPLHARILMADNVLCQCDIISCHEWIKTRKNKVNRDLS